MLGPKDDKVDFKSVRGYYIPIFKNMFISRDRLRSSFRKILDIKDPTSDISECDLVAAEVGVFEGENARYMLTFARKLKLYLIDDYENLVIFTGGPLVEKDAREQVKTAAELNLSAYNGRKEWVNKKSLLASRDFPDEFFDYVYIDGDHEYESVKADIVAWYPKVKKGGILGGHDVNMLSVKNALGEFVVEMNIPNGNWWAELNKEPKSDWWIIK